MELKITVSDDFDIPSSCNRCQFITVERDEYTEWDEKVLRCMFTGKKYDTFDIPCRAKDESCPFR